MTEKGHLRLVANDDFYQALRKKIKTWSEGAGRGHRFIETVLIAPDLFHLMTRLCLDKRTPPASKVRLGAAIVYFVSPLDLLPEAILGPIGYLDDIAVAAWALDGLIKEAGPELALEHWAGDADLLDALARITASVNDMIGAGLARRLKENFERQSFAPKLPARREPGRLGSAD